MNGKPDDHVTFAVQIVRKQSPDGFWRADVSRVDVTIGKYWKDYQQYIDWLNMKWYRLVLWLVSLLLLLLLLSLWYNSSEYNLFFFLEHCILTVLRTNFWKFYEDLQFFTLIVSEQIHNRCVIINIEKYYAHDEESLQPLNYKLCKVWHTRNVTDIILWYVLINKCCSSTRKTKTAWVAKY